MRKTLSIIFNLFIGVMSFFAWVFMAVLRIDQGMLTAMGVSSLKYFTVLSNLFNGIVCIIYAIWLIKGVKITSRKRLIKLIGTTAVGLTFLTVMVFLGPLFGYPMMFRGANLWMHLILPVASFVTFIFLEQGEKIPVIYSALGMIPTLLYGSGYIVNMLINGVEGNDIYGFLHWGIGIGAAIAAVIVLVSWGIALVLGCAGRSFIRKSKS